MINYSITARAVNPNLFEINQAKTRINQAKAEGKQPDPKDEALVGTVVTNYFATAQYTEVMTIEKFARHIADHGTTYSRADIMAILYMAVDCMREQLLEASVSAMQPCSASFNSLPLPREYNITNMTAAKRYESVWNAFLNELPHNPTTTLTSFLKRCNVRQGRMKRWMENNGLSVKEAKKRLRDCRHDGIGDPMPPLSEDSGSLFLPMATDKPAPRSESCDILSGVSLTFPDGTQVNIKRGSAQAVMSFLKLYQREDLPCLD